MAKQKNQQRMLLVTEFFFVFFFVYFLWFLEMFFHLKPLRRTCHIFPLHFQPYLMLETKGVGVLVWFQEQITTCQTANWPELSRFITQPPQSWMGIPMRVIKCLNKLGFGNYSKRVLYCTVPSACWGSPAVVTPGKGAGSGTTCREDDLEKDEEKHKIMKVWDRRGAHVPCLTTSLPRLRRRNVLRSQSHTSRPRLVQKHIRPREGAAEGRRLHTSHAWTQWDSIPPLREQLCCGDYSIRVIQLLISPLTVV